MNKCGEVWKIRKLLLILMVVWSPAAALGKTTDSERLLARQLTLDQGLFFALARGDLETMNTLALTQKASPNASLSLLGLKTADVFGSASPILDQPFDPSGWPILHWAVFLDDLDAVKTLLRAGARVNSADVYGGTALHWAAWGGRHSIAKLLLNNGANCWATDIRRRTPKDWAVMSSQNDMVILLDSRTCRSGAKDSDGDGVPEQHDICPNTPKGAMVDERGCWVVAYANFFDFDKSIVKSQYIPHLANAAEVIKNTPGLKVDVQGHADYIGTDEYNLKLGLRRAEAVKRVLEGFGANPGALVISSMGERQPIADNRTAHGRALNRRVEIHVREPGTPQDVVGAIRPGSAAYLTPPISPKPAATPGGQGAAAPPPLPPMVETRGGNLPAVR